MCLQIGDNWLLYEDKIGEGGFGKVYLGRDLRNNKVIAVKQVVDNVDKKDDNKTARQQKKAARKVLVQEVNALRLLEKHAHPNIVDCLGIARTKNNIYIFLGYCEGGSLHHLLKQERKMSESRAWKMAGQIVDGLNHLHALNIVHRDLKPQNILVTRVKKKIQLKIADFGLARVITPKRTMTTGMCTQAYQTPEMFHAERYNDTSMCSAVLICFVFIYKIYSACRKCACMRHSRHAIHIRHAIACMKMCTRLLMFVLLI